MARYWNDKKNALNKRDHRVSFDTAFRVFSEDPHAITAEDFIDDNGEVRYQTLGLVDGRLLLVAHVYRVIAAEGEMPWLIMARKATDYEKQIYTAQRKH